MIGTGIGSFGAALSAAGAIIYSNFYLFCLSIFCLGILSGFAQLYRFAAADVATHAFKTKAVSLVMIGGIIAGFIGPTVASNAKDLIPNAEFAGSYMFVIMFPCFNCFDFACNEIFLDLILLNKRVKPVL